jgi:hypothetical protein
LVAEPIVVEYPLNRKLRLEEAVRLAKARAPRGVKADTQTMYDQFVCHWFFVREIPGRAFHLQNWYPAAGFVTEAKDKCNPAPT